VKNRLLRFGLGIDGEIYAAWSNGQITELVPEPATWVMGIIGVVIIPFAYRRCRPLAA
jgi:hypothetical protein